MPAARKNAARRRRGPGAGERLLDLLAGLAPAASAALLLVLAASLFVPGSLGGLGRAASGALLAELGGAAYLLPFLGAWALLCRLRDGRPRGLATMSAGALFLVAGAAALLGLLGAAVESPLGGAAGDALARWGTAALGSLGLALAAAALALLGLRVLFGVSALALGARALRLLREDYLGWLRSREELSAAIADAARRRLPSGGGEPRMAPMPDEAREAAAPAPAPAEPAAATDAEPAPEAKPRARKKAEAPAAGAYPLPPLELLRPRSGDAAAGRPTEAQIQEAVASLEATLRSFEIDARVSGIRPGPVITRYEVSPAPGVTVNSITARADDIALAMKARGIRMIAPIPGMAAIGIEIPNPRPATVTLREALESRAMTEADSPLAFALGLSSEGTPLAADLMTMPHVLVAGATNSGKSVMVHALIASLLFRRRPDEVKLLLIDPKRIELTLYDGIPHLYDPKTPPAEVAVITQAKNAAGALKALVRVMEDRYEKFQAWRVQNIQQFNREAARRGEPREFYIVVVIDELADLMVVARDVVEDSIQRLTQMARAVGIHMVIATQRPSVDVLTGVIKANLPSRIAMRVASKVDSKVVIDGNGAEALLGRGDALYVTPGQDPARIQGAFVSTGEIGALVDYLRERAKPDYPLLDTMAAGAGEADLSAFGVEALEFTQALKLVLERRRVSQDLLKSQFGSSARATNLLSLLEVKGFIHKPEGSNRWEIHFEKIEDYLRANHPQVNLDKPGI